MEELAVGRSGGGASQTEGGSGCKGPGPHVNLMCLMNSKEAGVAWRSEQGREGAGSVSGLSAPTGGRSFPLRPWSCTKPERAVRHSV